MLLDDGLKISESRTVVHEPSFRLHLQKQKTLALTVGLAPRVMLRFLTKPVHKPDGSADARLAATKQF